MRLAFALYGQVAGIIERRGGRTSLEYLPAYQRLADPTPLSVSMPVSATSYTSKRVVAYLSGLLPDNALVRERWAARAGVRPTNTLALISHVGLDVSGGAIFAGEGEIDDAITRAGTHSPASEAEIAARLRRVRQDESAWQGDDDEEHWSLAGAQSKFTLAHVNGGWSFAEGSAPSTHIIKPGLSTIRGQALAEHASMRALAIVGLDVAETRYLTFEDQSAIVVTRFDRRTAATGRLIRVHQEDLIQAFALNPDRKYEEHGGPGAQAIGRLLRTVADNDSVTRFARAVIANQILGAPDAHGKNHGILLVGSTATLAPLYDVATGLVPDSTGRLRWSKGALAVGGERRFGDVERSNWVKFARSLQLHEADVLDWVAELATAIPPAFEQAASEAAAPDSDFLAGEVTAHIAAVARQILNGLTQSRRTQGRIRAPFIQTLNRTGKTARVDGDQLDDAPGEPDDEPWGS